MRYSTHRTSTSFEAAQLCNGASLNTRPNLAFYPLVWEIYSVLAVEFVETFIALELRLNLSDNLTFLARRRIYIWVDLGTWIVGCCIASWVCLLRCSHLLLWSEAPLQLAHEHTILRRMMMDAWYF